MPSRRNNVKSRQSATSAYQRTQSSAKPTSVNPAPAPTPAPSSPTFPSSSPGRKGGDYVHRPMNPFMLFRSHVYRNGLISGKHQGDLSAAAAKMWNALSEEEKAPWKAEADRVKQEHMERYPGYTFTPGKKMTPSEAMAAKPLSESAGKIPTAVRTGTAAMSRSKRPTTSAHSAAQHQTRTSTRKATQTVTAPVAASPTAAIGHLEVFSDDGNNTINNDLTPITPVLADNDAYQPMLYPDDPVDMDFALTTGEVLTPTFSYGFDETVEQQLMKINASTDESWFPVNTPEYALQQQETLDSDGDDEWKKMFDDCIMEYEQ